LGTSLDPPLLTAWYPYIMSLLAIIGVSRLFDSVSYHCIHRSVNHASVQLDNLLNRVNVLEVDCLGSYLCRSIKALLDTVDETSNRVSLIACRGFNTSKLDVPQSTYNTRLAPRKTAE
jgi:hypothetical protein